MGKKGNGTRQERRIIACNGTALAEAAEQVAGTACVGLLRGMRSQLDEIRGGFCDNLPFFAPHIRRYERSEPLLMRKRVTVAV